MASPSQTLQSCFPELGISNYTSVDGSVEFFGRVHSIARPEMTVLDYGAGRGAWFENTRCDYKKDLRQLQGKVGRVVGCDVDPVVLEHPAVDESVIIEIGKPLPFEDQSFDMVVSDFTFEHIEDARFVAQELCRILKPGGWICARTPNKYSLVAVMASLFHNSLHNKILNRAQSNREEHDVFPTVYKLNTLSAIRKHFASETFDNYTYRIEPEPAYFFNSKLVLRLMLLFNRLSPPFMKSNLLIFLRKKDTAH